MSSRPIHADTHNEPAEGGGRGGEERSFTSAKNVGALTWQMKKKRKIHVRQAYGNKRMQAKKQKQEKYALPSGRLSFNQPTPELPEPPHQNLQAIWNRQSHRHLPEPSRISRLLQNQLPHLTLLRAPVGWKVEKSERSRKNGTRFQKVAKQPLKNFKTMFSGSRKGCQCQG